MGPSEQFSGLRRRRLSNVVRGDRGWPVAKRRLVRLGAMCACSLSALALTSCIGGLPVTVTSVTGTLEPYNPQFGNQGIPAEQVDFTVGDYTGSTDLICLIGVYHVGQLVGSTIATFGSQGGTSTPGGVDKSVAVEISLPSPFDGAPSDAKVGCIARR